jgi:hypothetical protein
MSIAADCGGGVCVRAQRPGRLRVFRCQQPAGGSRCGGSDRVSFGTYVVSIPNGSRSVSLPVSGGIFADNEHALTLRNGVLVSSRRVTGAELQGAFNAAGELIGAFTAGALSATQSREAQIEAETELLRARQAYEQLLASGASPRPESSLTGGNSEGFVAGVFGPLPRAIGSQAEVPQQQRERETPTPTPTPTPGEAPSRPGGVETTEGSSGTRP